MTSMETYENQVLYQAELESTPRVTGIGMPPLERLGASSTYDMASVQTVLSRLRSKSVAVVSSSSSSSLQDPSDSTNSATMRRYLQEQMLICFLQSVVTDGNFVHVQQEARQEELRRTSYNNNRHHQTPSDRKRPADTTRTNNHDISLSTTTTSSSSSSSSLATKPSKRQRRSTPLLAEDMDDTKALASSMMSSPNNKSWHDMTSSERLEFIKNHPQHKQVSFANVVSISLLSTSSTSSSSNQTNQPFPRSRISIMKRKRISSDGNTHDDNDDDDNDDDTRWKLQQETLKKYRKQREQRRQQRRQTWMPKKQLYYKEQEDEEEEEMEFEGNDKQTILPNTIANQSTSSSSTSSTTTTLNMMESSSSNITTLETEMMTNTTTIVEPMPEEKKEEDRSMDPIKDHNIPSNTTIMEGNESGTLKATTGTLIEKNEMAVLPVTSNTTPPTKSVTKTLSSGMSCPLCLDNIEIPNHVAQTEADFLLSRHMEQCQNRRQTRGQRRSSRITRTMKNYAEDEDDGDDVDGLVGQEDKQSIGTRRRPIRTGNQDEKSKEKESNQRLQQVNDDVSEMGDQDMGDESDELLIDNETGDERKPPKASARTLRSSVAKKQTTSLVTPLRMSTSSQSLDDWDELDYEDRVDDWIETGIDNMKEMKERDRFETPPGEAVYEGGLVIPAWINDRLFPYQRTGLQWMWELHRQEAGGIIGDEMVRFRIWKRYRRSSLQKAYKLYSLFFQGLGKTVQVSAFLGSMASSRKLKCILIISPATMLQHWLKELAKWAPGLRRILIHPSGEVDGRSRTLTSSLLKSMGQWLRQSRRNRLFEAIDEDDLVTRDPASFCGTGYVFVTTYENVRRSPDVWINHAWSYVVMDEAQKIRNPDADITLTCKVR